MKLRIARLSLNTHYILLSVCLSVSNTSVTPDQISTSSNIYRHKSLYWTCATKYQAVPTYNDPIPPSSSQYHLIYWPSTIKYQLASIYNSPSLNAYLSQLHLFSFYDLFDESLTHSILGILVCFRVTLCSMLVANIMSKGIMNDFIRC